MNIQQGSPAEALAELRSLSALVLIMRILGRFVDFSSIFLIFYYFIVVHALRTLIIAKTDLAFI